MRYGLVMGGRLDLDDLVGPFQPCDSVICVHTVRAEHLSPSAHLPIALLISGQNLLLSIFFLPGFADGNSNSSAFWGEFLFFS